MKFRDFVRILREQGFTLDRQESSHRVFKGVVAGKIHLVVVAYHREGALNAMIRQSGLDKKLFR